MTRAWTACLLLLAVGIGFAAGGGVRVLVGERPLAGRYRLEGGAVVGPVAPVARALGAQVEWDPGTLRLTRRPWRSLELESLAGVACGPYDLTALGPAIAVRQHLAAKQAEWLKARDPKAPLLARYEVTGAINWYSGPTSGDPDSAGFTIRALLYWLEPDPKHPTPLDARFGEGGPDGGLSAGPRPRRLVVQEAVYHLKPTAVTRRPADDGVTRVDAGGWVLDEEPDVKTVRTVDLTRAHDETSGPAVFDVVPGDVEAGG